MDPAVPLLMALPVVVVAVWNVALLIAKHSSNRRHRTTMKDAFAAMDNQSRAIKEQGAALSKMENVMMHQAEILRQQHATIQQQRAELNARARTVFGGLS